jgi:hypothetical protein
MGGFKMRLAKVLANPVSGAHGVINLLTETATDVKNNIMQPIKNLIPINARAFASDIIGNVTGIDSFKSEINESHLSAGEKEAITNARIQAEKNNRNFIGYNDYFPAEDNIEVPSANTWDGGDVDHKESNSQFLENVMDDRYATKTTFGRMNFSNNDDGTVTYTDQFDYNDAKEGGFSAFKEDLDNNPDLSMYQKLRKAGTYLGSGPGEGAKVNITY